MSDIRARRCPVGDGALLCFVTNTADHVQQHMLIEMGTNAAPRVFLESPDNVMIEVRLWRDVLLAWGTAPRGRLRLVDLPLGAIFDARPGDEDECDFLIDASTPRIIFARARSFDEPKRLFELRAHDGGARIGALHGPIRDVLAVRGGDVFAVTPERMLIEAGSGREIAKLDASWDLGELRGTISPNGVRLAIEATPRDAKLALRDLVVIDLSSGKRLVEARAIEVTRHPGISMRPSLDVEWISDDAIRLTDAVVAKRGLADFEAEYREVTIAIATGERKIVPVSRVGPKKRETLVERAPKGPERKGGFIVTGDARIDWAATNELAWHAHDEHVWNASVFSQDGIYAAVADSHLNQLLLLDSQTRATTVVWNGWTHSPKFLPPARA